MKKILFAVLSALAGWPAAAGDVQWLTDLPTAQAQAKAEHKLVLMDFTGSDWCPPCIRFEKEVLDSSEFQTYAANNVVVVEVDFPDKKPQSRATKDANEALQNKYKVDGFPTLVVLGPDGKEIGREESYTPGSGPKSFIAQLERFKGGK